MTSRLLYKEFRETIWIVAAAMAVELYFGFMVMGVSVLPGMYGGSYGAIPFIHDGFQVALGMVWACLAIVLGLRQTVGESAFGTFPFLLHRPVGRQRLIEAKLLVGLVLYLVCSALAIVVYGWWAATPGNHASPFEWSMTVPSWMTWAAMTVLYLGAFLAGMRPGRWYGSRLLPVAALLALAVVLGVPPWWSWQIPGLPWWSLGVTAAGVILVTDVLLVRNIFYVARTRDY